MSSFPWLTHAETTLPTSTPLCSILTGFPTDSCTASVTSCSRRKNPLYELSRPTGLAVPHTSILRLP
eukprot:599696-Rhodomonas_salina.1